MIEPGIFANEWAVLVERFGKYRDSELMAKRYLEHLSPRLSTDEFVAAARHLFATSEFFPRPQDFIDVAGRSRQAVAQDDWEHCQRAMRGDRTAYQRLSDEGRRVVRMMGGLDRLRMTKLGQIDWRRKEFLELHGSRGPDVERLPPMTEDGRKLIEDALAGRLEA